MICCEINNFAAKLVTAKFAPRTLSVGSGARWARAEIALFGVSNSNVQVPETREEPKLTVLLQYARRPSQTNAAAVRLRAFSHQTPFLAWRMAPGPVSAWSRAAAACVMPAAPVLVASAGAPSPRLTSRLALLQSSAGSLTNMVAWGWRPACSRVCSALSEVEMKRG